MQKPQANQEFSAWNPGLNPLIPKPYQSLESIYQVMNVTSQFSDTAELAALTGLRPEELVAFSAERLVLHELIIRVCADIVIPEEKEEEALGRHFRHICHHLLKVYLAPHKDEVKKIHEALRQRAEQRVQQILTESLFPPPVSDKPAKTRFSLFALLTGKKPSVTQKRHYEPLHETLWDREYQQLNRFREAGLTAQDAFERSVYKSMYQVLGALASKQGYIGSDRQLLTDLIVQNVCNTYGSQLIGAYISPYILQAAKQEAYPLSRPAQKPILISLKGASAAGKSSLRPMLQHIMAQQGIAAKGYCTISPDIWRRLLLDYDSLGDAYKYAGALTSNEVNVIDSKLDRYIRDKAQRDQSIPHLLVDRFRFDSFASDKVSHILHDTYAKYIDTLYMYFVITPPEDTVVRGWERGLQRGRYKAVEDFLGFSVEAYIGMPKLLFKWLAYRRPRFNYVFLDNSVAKGTRPKNIAFGDQDVMHIHNPMAFVNIERYQKINIKARCPAEVYPEKTDFSVANNIGFLQQCLSRIAQINFIDEETGNCYLEVEHGQVKLLDRPLFKSQLVNQAWQPIFNIIAPKLMKSLQDEAQG